MCFTNICTAVSHIVITNAPTVENLRYICTGRQPLWLLSKENNCRHFFSYIIIIVVIL